MKTILKTTVGFLLLFTLFSLMGCDPIVNGDDKTTASEAKTIVTKRITEISKTVTDAPVELSEFSYSPCGGIEGSEYTKVTVGSGATINLRNKTNVSEMINKLKTDNPEIEFIDVPVEQLEVQNRDMFQEIQFNSDEGTPHYGSVSVTDNGMVEISVSSRCVSNPDRVR